MSNRAPYPPAVRPYTGPHGNPYGFITGEDIDQQLPTSIQADLAAGSPVPHVRHPYALIQNEAVGSGHQAAVVESATTRAVGITGSKPPTADRSRQIARTSKSRGLSQAAFRTACRSIFRRYIPAAEAGTLRSHHREFIDRNESRSPEQRLELIDHLRRYDLGQIPGLSAQFNRERDVFTESKLTQVERLVDEQD